MVKENEVTNADKLAALLAEMYATDEIGTVKALLSSVSEHVQTLENAAKTVGVSPATFTGFWRDDDETPTDSPKFELIRLAQSNAIETPFVRGRLYLTSGMELVKAKRAEIAPNGRVKHESAINISTARRWATVYNVTLPDDKNTSGDIIAYVASKLGMDTIKLTAVINQAEAKIQQDAYNARAAALAEAASE